MVDNKSFTVSFAKCSSNKEANCNEKPNTGFFILLNDVGLTLKNFHRFGCSNLGKRNVLTLI